MPRLKLYRVDFWIYIIAVFILGFVCGFVIKKAEAGGGSNWGEVKNNSYQELFSGWTTSMSVASCNFSFSSPSSEARFQLESGFFGAVAHVGRASALQSEDRRFNSCLLHSFTESNAQGGWASKPTENGALERARPPTFTVTAYCPNSCCCGEFADGITASGHIIQEGDRFVAAPPEIPFNSYLSIEGYADGLPVEVRDRGGAIKGNKLDVFFDSHDEAIVWGVKVFEIGD